MQIPVVINRKVVGILDIFDYLENEGKPVSELMIKDFEVAFPPP